MPVTLHSAILSLGSNLGNRAAWLTKATNSIAELPGTQINARSSIYETEPVDVPDQFNNESFLNAVIIIETQLTASRLSDSIHRIEDQLQRTRGIPNQPRTIDIDIITFDDLISDATGLTLPHPRAHLRRFVLQPLAEIEPDLILPGQKEDITTLLRSLPDLPSVKLFES